MSKLAELLVDLCSDGVSMSLVRDVFSAVQLPAKIKRSQYSDGTKYPIVDQGQSFICGYTDDEKALLPDGQYVVFGDHTRALKWVDFRFAAGADGTKVLKSAPEVLPKFGFYALSSLNIPSRGYNRHWTILRDLKIPVPSLEVQQEIVRVLDAFTDLEQSLVSELELRKKQFDEYRTGAIKSLDRVDCKALGDVVQIRNGRDWKTQKSGDVPVYGSGGRMPQGVASPSSVGPAVLLPRKGSLEVQYVDEPIWNVDTVFTTACDTEVLDTRFFFHVMKTLDLGRISTSATRPSLTQSALRKLSIPVPPLEVQQEIVAKLDAFSDLIQSIEQEISLRRQQYEFYRDELLSFAPEED